MNPSSHEGAIEHNEPSPDELAAEHEGMIVRDVDPSPQGDGDPRPASASE